jgi:hypothetical protein
VKISRHGGGADAERLREDLDEMLEADRRTGPVCGAACQRPGSPDCSRHCPDIPRALSSDPERYPLETRIAPLVFELKRLGVFEPCWSCEGHLKHDGTLWKLPQVWFYCRSVVHVRVLADGVKDLHVAGKLSAPWQVALTHSDDDNADTTFALKPALDRDTPGNLAGLQRDIDTIAAHLHQLVLNEVQSLSRQVR